jgi:MFS family permease
MGDDDLANFRNRLSRVQVFRALRHRNFRWFWFSGLGQSAAQGMRQFALPWLVLELTGSLTQLGLVIFMQGLPMAIVALVGGVLADRFDRRMLLIWSQAVTMSSIVALATLTATERVELWHIYAASFVAGGSQALSMPARQAFVRSLVDRDDVMNAVALNSMLMTSAMIVWPSIAGVLIQFWGMGPTLYANAACFVVGIGALLFMRGVNIVSVAKDTPLHRMMIEGFRYSLNTPIILAIMALSMAIAILGMPYMNLVPGFAREVLGMGAGQAGLLMMFGGVGALVGSIVLASVNVRHKNRLFVGLGFTLATGLILFAANPWYYASFAIIMVMGMAGSTIPLVGNSIMLIVVPPHLLGRVVSIWSFTAGFISMAGLPIGFLGEVFGLRWSLGGSAAILLLFVLWLGVIRSPLRKPYQEALTSRGPVTPYATQQNQSR